MALTKLARRALATLVMSMLCLVAFAQSRSVTGTIVDGLGEPVIGANVLEVGTSNGVVTDVDGNFRLTVKDNAQLRVSYVGFNTQVVKVGNQSKIKVYLKEDDKTLDEVVVIGYGTVKRRDLTGSVASVNGDRLAANPVANVAEALQGALPGVSVISQDGRPGASISSVYVAVVPSLRAMTLCSLLTVYR